MLASECVLASEQPNNGMNIEVATTSSSSTWAASTHVCGIIN